MDRFKFFLERFQKEIIIGVVFLVFIVGGVGIYCLFQKEESTENLLLSDQNIEENVEKVEEEQEEKDFRIDIKGEIKNPGVYIAREDMRVIDIVEMAGGLTKNADTSVNNLSKKVVDEMVIKIYSKSEVKKFSETKEKEEDILKKSQTIIEGLKNEGALKEEDLLPNHSTNTSSDEQNNSDLSVSKISINTATKEELLSLKGIGESKALAIIAYRQEHGNFQKIEDIMLVSGIGESVFEKIKDFITI